MQNVTLINLGENLPIELSVLARQLNSLQDYFIFQEEASVPIARIGKPDFEDQWYFIDRLLDILHDSRDPANHELIIGITHLRITEKLHKDGDNGNRDYFSLSDFSVAAVISLDPNVLIFNAPSKDIYQFATFSIAGELLNLIAKEDICHLEVDHCLFDECVDRTSIKPAIEKSWICERCMAKLKANGVPQHPIDSCRHFLDWCRKDIGHYSSLSRTIMSPLTIFLIGNAVGWVSSAFIDKSSWKLIVFPSIVMISLLYVYYLVQHFKRSSPNKGIQRTGA